MCDQLNASTLGLYGGPVGAPNVAALASEGVVFAQLNASALGLYGGPVGAP